MVIPCAHITHMPTTIANKNPVNPEQLSLQFHSTLSELAMIVNNEGRALVERRDNIRIVLQIEGLHTVPSVVKKMNE